MKSVKKSLCIGIVLLCLIGAGFVGAASGETITSIALTGITPPAYGASTTTDSIATTTNNITLGTKEWMIGSDSAGSTFEYDKAYKLVISYTPAPGCNVSANAGVTGAGTETASIDTANNKITITYPKLPKPATDLTFTVSGIVAPVANETPKTTKPSVTSTPAGVITDISAITWKAGNSPLNAGAKFAYDTVYTAEFTITVNNSVNIGTVTVNKPSNETSADGSTSGQIVTVKITYPKTAAAPVTTKPKITSFSVTPLKGSYPLEITIKYETTGATQCYLVIDNDNESLPSTSGTLKETLTSAGNYVVKLVAVNAIGPVEDSKTVKVVKPIDLVYINDLTAPATNTIPDTTADTNTTGIKSVTVVWNTTSNEAVAKFARSTEYVATITLTADTGYTFNSSKPTVYLSGVSEKLSTSEETLSKSNTVLTIRHTYPATSAATGPAISFTMEPENPTIPSNAENVLVTFKYTITGDPTSSKISFGDGTEADLGTMTSGSKTHTYSRIGSYEATLTSTNASGPSSKSISVRVSKEGLYADFTASPTSGTAPLTVSVSDKSTGTILSRSWEFGDGSIETTKTATHTYEKAGDYIITLTVTDGVTSSKKTQIIKVSKSDSGKEDSEVNYTPMMIIGDTEIPSPIDIIAEFVRLIKSIPELLTDLLHG